MAAQTNFLSFIGNTGAGETDATHGLTSRSGAAALLCLSMFARERYETNDRHTRATSASLARQRSQGRSKGGSGRGTSVDQTGGSSGKMG